jgi:hypothetical protein
MVRNSHDLNENCLKNIKPPLTNPTPHDGLHDGLLHAMRFTLKQYNTCQSKKNRHLGKTN